MFFTLWNPKHQNAVSFSFLSLITLIRGTSAQSAQPPTLGKVFVILNRNNFLKLISAHPQHPGFFPTSPGWRRLIISNLSSAEPEPDGLWLLIETQSVSRISDLTNDKIVITDWYRWSHISHTKILLFVADCLKALLLFFHSWPCQ